MAEAGWWNPLRAVLIAGSVVYGLGLVLTSSCASNGWVDPDRLYHLCYSDVPVLYELRGLADGLIPYLEWPQGAQPLEYPVLIGGFMYVAAGITSALTGAGTSAVVFYYVTAIALFAFFLVALAATSLTVRGRMWDGMLLAVAPSVALASTINWDWLAVALTALALLAWSRRMPLWAGVALGLAVSAKFYPLLLLGPMFLLCFRAGRLRQWALLATATVGSWAVVNIPLAVASPEGWSYFFRFSAERGQDYGSVWLALEIAGLDLSGVNALALGSFVALCAGIAALILMAPVRPRVAQVAFLIIAAFLVTNKVYSPQFVLWLLPLAVLARPRWRDIIWWQVAEVVYFVSIWWYLVSFTEAKTGLPESVYAVAILVHIVATLALAALVVRDILIPRFDPVRSDGVPLHQDDPGGGVLDGAKDRWALRRRSSTV